MIVAQPPCKSTLSDRQKRALLLVVTICLAGLLSCEKKPSSKRYDLQGRVVAVDTGARQITIAHEDIPSLMKGMTMPFVLGAGQDWVLQQIGPGDRIHATLVLNDHAELQDISFTKHSDTEGDGTSNLRIPQPGDPVPDFFLTNQDGKSIQLSQFKGKPLLLTFIYTRCPVPDYCPLMSNNFSAVLRQLEKDPKALAAAQLLSISIDPEYDRSPVLRSYGEHYVQRTDPQFRHWQFASGTPEQVRRAADFFGLSYNQKDSQIVHNLRTVLIGPDGKVAKIYNGNRWQPDEVAADFAAAVAR